MPNEKKSQEPIKVTDKRIFTAEGNLREEYRSEIKPAEKPQHAVEAAPPEPERTPAAAAPPPEEPSPRPETARKKGLRHGENPETPFTLFLESLIYSAYASLGMVQNPYQQAAVDLDSARQMIDIVSMLAEKTKGNLTEDETAFLDAHLSQLRLAYVQRSKAVR